MSDIAYFLKRARFLSYVFDIFDIFDVKFYLIYLIPNNM